MLKLIDSRPGPGALEFLTVLKRLKPMFGLALLFSCAVNLLYLAPSLYMLQVYDRVLASANRTTLVMLTLVLLVAVAVLAILDALRARVLARAGLRLDRLLAARLFGAAVDAGLANGARSQALRDLDTVRQFTGGPGLQVAFDLPWFPIYLVVLFLLHPALGVFALLTAVVLLAVAVAGEARVTRSMSTASDAAIRSYAFTESSLRNSEVIRALGMLPAVLRSWGEDRSTMLVNQARGGDRAADVQALTRMLRLSAQSLMLGLGAWLVIDHALSAGAIFAATLLLGRALQPIELAVGAWRGLTSARDSVVRLVALLSAAPVGPTKLALPKPTGSVQVEGLAYLVDQRPIVRGISFTIAPGEVIGVVGPSGAGKSTLARLLLGLSTPAAGSVRLDGADITQWPREALGAHLGYLPQDVELFPGTVAANIGRLDTSDPEAIIAAARLAGVHDIVLRLPEGYDTAVGERGAVLSGGVRQRIGLARAVYGKPALVVLDEPSSNLDADGDAALAACVTRLKAQGTTVVVISHRPHTMAVADKILVLREGAIALFGPRAEVMARLAPSPSAPPLRPAGLNLVGAAS